MILKLRAKAFLSALHLLCEAISTFCQFLLTGNSPRPEAEQTTIPDIVYTLSEVSTHSTSDNCWMVLDGVVYDFTSYISNAQHPGGKTILKECGRDGTFLFRNDPPHSQQAEFLLPDYAIGRLVN